MQRLGKGRKGTPTSQRRNGRSCKGHCTFCRVNVGGPKSQSKGKNSNKLYNCESTANVRATTIASDLARNPQFY